MSALFANTPLFQRILLTGGGGFVGGTLAPAIASAFPDAERLLLRRPGSKEERAGWPTVEADVCDEPKIRALVQQFEPDLVVHLAAQSSVGAGNELAAATWRTNLGGTLALAQACAMSTPPSTFFFTSSSEVYGLSFRDGAVSESAPVAPTSVYGRSKAAAEQVLADVLPSDTRLIIVRSFNHTGPGQDERFVLPSFAAQIARIEAGCQPAELKVGNLDAERDFLDVRDVCDAYVRLIRATPSLPLRGIFNVSSGSAYSIRQLVGHFRSLSRVKFEITVDQDRLRPSDIPRAVGANNRIREVLGWSPSYTIETTLAMLLVQARANLS